MGTKLARSATVMMRFVRAHKSNGIAESLGSASRGSTKPLSSNAIVRYATSGSAVTAKTADLKGMAPSNNMEYAVTKLDDCTLL